MYAKLVFPEKNSRSTFTYLKIFYFGIGPLQSLINGSTSVDNTH